VTGIGDYHNEMSPRHQLDDETIEAFFAGRPLATGESACLAAFAEEVRLAAEGPVPVPSPALAAVLAEGFSTDKGDLPATAASNVPGPATQVAGLPKRRSKRMVVTELLAGLTMAAKAGLGLTMAAASVTAAGAGGVLPDPVQGAVGGAVEAVTPFSFPDKADDKADFGKRVSTDATDEGVDGKTIAEEAKQHGAEHRDSAPVPENRASNGQKGLDQANTTPAAGHAPRSVPDGRATADQRRPSGATERQPERPAVAPEGTPTGQPAETPSAGQPAEASSGAPESTPSGAPEGTPSGAPEGTSTDAPEGTPSGAPAYAPSGRG
jgi:hypothetical protein